MRNIEIKKVLLVRDPLELVLSSFFLSFSFTLRRRHWKMSSHTLVATE